ncbi:DNA (cytosine-5)-methyltransferase 1 [Neorhizobium sp. S3-V5DH]|nr:DNA (cytosine-5)-methyltransferase 1 [Neorhizobium sp. S3-V5DH]
MAWRKLGWTPEFFSEIEAFPSAVLAHHYGSNMPGEPLAKNGIPNYGDFTQIGPEAGPIDLLVGGTPCQSFSVAGKRLGLDDPRGNLALEYLALARRLRARWIVWENVPGVLSSHTDEEQAEEDVEGDDGLESADFATFLSFVQECGYGFAYRVLDAQYIRVDDYARAVPQRRRRVFLVGYLGDWRRAAAVLLEPEGMRGDSAPRREAGKGVAGAITASAGRRGGTDDPERGKLVAEAFGGGNTSGPIDVSTALTAHGQRQDFEVETFVAEIAATLPAGGNSTGGERQPRMGAETAATMLVAHALRGEGFDASEDGTGRGTPIVPVSFGGQMSTPMWDFDLSQTLQEKNPQAVAFSVSQNSNGFAWESEVNPTLQARAQSETANQIDGVRQGWAVRRLMPIECERLQGFPDNFTNVPWRGKDTAPDGPRYKALGNSMAVNAMRWIGQRIDIMEKLIKAGRIAA